MQAGIQANQLASTIDHASNITNLPKITQASFFFSQDSRDMFFNFCVCHKKGVSEKQDICETNTYYVCFH